MKETIDNKFFTGEEFERIKESISIGFGIPIRYLFGVSDPLRGTVLEDAEDQIMGDIVDDQILEDVLAMKEAIRQEPCCNSDIKGFVVHGEEIYEFGNNECKPLL